MIGLKGQKTRNMYFKKLHLVLFVIILLGLISASAAINTNDTTEVIPQQAVKEITADTGYVSEYNNNNPTETQIAMDIPEKQLANQENPTAITLTSENFDTYITDGLLNDNVPDGANIDVKGRFDGERYAFTINKPINLFSSTNDAFFCFYSTQKLEGNYEIPNYSFMITKDGSGSNITGITFEDTMIVTKGASNVTFDNLSVYCTTGYGWGLGSTSIRNSENVTIKNSYFDTVEETVWSSTVVFAASQYCLIENCTVIGRGFVGNLVYATTYNVELINEYGNLNITVRGNKIIGRDITPGLQTCYSVCLIGENLTVENNYIENRNGYLIMSQYHDDEYSADGAFRTLVIRNNSLGPGKIGVEFDPCTIVNNTFYGTVKLDVKNNTLQENNTEKDANENPYLTEEESILHPTIVNITAPKRYTYDENNTFAVTVTDLKNNQNITEGYLEVYSDGTFYKNITITNQTTIFTYSNPEIGEHHVRAWYYPTNNSIMASQKVHTIKSEKIMGQLTLETKDNPEIGEKVTLNATYTLNKNISHNANITFSLPGQNTITLPANNNTATLESTITTNYIRDILGGREQSIRITVTTNDTNIEIEGITKKLGVQKASTNIRVTPETTIINTPTTITATINTPTGITINKGTITFTTNGETIATVNVKNNKATTTYTFNSTGTTAITATYSGTVHYKTSSTTYNIQIEKQNIGITLNPIANVVYGHNVTITGRFTDGDGNIRANSSLRITINGKNITTKTNNKGEFSVTSKVGSVGINNVTASYAGDSNYNPTNTTATFTMTKQKLVITLNPIATTGYGANVTVSGSFVDGDGNARANNELKININGKSVTATTDKNGHYAYITSMGKLGTNNVTVSHAGGANYSPAEKTATYEVVKQNLKITLNDLGTVTYGSVTINGRLTDGLGNARANTGVKLLINGKSATAKTDTNGYFSFTTKAVKIGVNNVTASHNGGGNYNPTSTSTTFTMVKKDLKVSIDRIATVTYGDSVIITGKFTDGDGNIRANSNLKVIINGKTLTVKTDASGKFKAISKVGVIGTNNVTVAHSGGTGFNPTSTSTTFTMIKQDLIIKIKAISDVRKGSKFTVTGNFTDGNGKIRANTNLKVNINGKEYTTKTDSYGVFTYTSTATMMGTNTVTVSHAGGLNYNPASATRKFTVTS